MSSPPPPDTVPRETGNLSPRTSPRKDFGLDEVVEPALDPLSEELLEELNIMELELPSQPEVTAPRPPAPLRAGRSFILGVFPPSLRDGDEYLEWPAESTVNRVTSSINASDGTVLYNVKFADGHRGILSSSQLASAQGGYDALQSFEENPQHQSESDTSSQSELSASSSMSGDMTSSHARQARAKRSRAEGFVNIDQIDLSSDEDDLSSRRASRSRRQLLLNRKSHGSSESSTRASLRTENPRTSRLRSSDRTRGVKGARTIRIEDEDDDDDGDGDDDIPYVWSDRFPASRHEAARRKRLLKRGLSGGTRRSVRSTKADNSMRERGEDEIWAEDADDADPEHKAVGAAEEFKSLPEDDEFLLVHNLSCDSCGVRGDGKSKGTLVLCQGCTMSYHRSCLGSRANRDHIVTKVADGDYVLQCRRCVGTARRKDSLSPRQDACQVCKASGPACAAFRPKLTAKQEEKERLENGGSDPIKEVDAELIYNARNVLFRCTGCYRCFHFSHLPPRSDDVDMGDDGADVSRKRFREYSNDFSCIECQQAPSKLQSLVSWRPVDDDNVTHDQKYETLSEDSKEYLVKWQHRSYFQATWKPGAWVWGTTSPIMRNAFAKRNAGVSYSALKDADAIPEEFLRVDIVLDVRYKNPTGPDEGIDKARADHVHKALVKFKGLGYDEVVWERVPDANAVERWADYVAAFDDYLLGQQVHLPKQDLLKARVEEVRSLDFEREVEKQTQPGNLVGGELMGYQLEGMNWLLYQWHRNHNAILADEMGLGKTIQIIGFLATLVQDYTCWPFLVVVPNSTCPNWRREIKRWAPSLRVVTYYGSAEARALAMEYELFAKGKGGKDLKCHIVVTSYEAPIDETSTRFVKRIPWAGLIVDEGQRLKNDKNLLYEALSTLRFPFKILMTGTPLQNKPRELFNLLQFLDKDIDAARLEEEFAELNKENVPQLREMLRPFFLRRTKAQVLKFLPPIAQMIVPVTMSVVQKKLYRSILARNPQLIKSIFGREKQKLKQADRSNLNNILMQLRKCLCHPFVYSRLIEERDLDHASSIRGLVEASPKLQLLQIMLPKLKERGHRVLIFSQFLEMLDIVEDFLQALSMQYARLDGNVTALQKQNRIDAFNEADSPLFAFLLSTRAGGVGINLATADTVIILDPDFNPHQDIQALSRVHRIGQKKKVLVFQLMTRESAEEKIVQIGRRKMALDHVIIEQMDTDDAAEVDVDSILKHGASALFEDNDDRDIRYDSESVDKLLDRSLVEATKVGDDSTVESQFSFARVWAHDRKELQDDFAETDADDAAVDPTVWEKILIERERIAAVEHAARQQTFGRGKRRREAINYSKEALEGMEDAERAKRPEESSASSDTDFDMRQADDEDDSVEEAGAGANDVNPSELLPGNASRPATVDMPRVKPPRPAAHHGTQSANETPRVNDSARRASQAQAHSVPSQRLGRPPSHLQSSLHQLQQPRQEAPPHPQHAQTLRHPQYPPFAQHQAHAPRSFPQQPPPPPPPPPPQQQQQQQQKQKQQQYQQYRQYQPRQMPQRPPVPNNHGPILNEAMSVRPCPVCEYEHMPGQCPLRLRGPELCPVCGIAHFGEGTTCPVANDEQQCRRLLEAIRASNERRSLKDLAMAYVRGRIAYLTRKARLDAEKEAGLASQPSQVTGPPSTGPKPVSINHISNNNATTTTTNNNSNNNKNNNINQRQSLPGQNQRSNPAGNYSTVLDLTRETA